MNRDWAYLTKLTDGKPMTIERVAITGQSVAIEGTFELPPLARLRAEDQVFVAMFVKCHGSIKQMEKHLGVSYPTIKGRLNRIGEQLDFVEVETSEVESDVLDRLERGDINVEEALKSLRKEKGK